MPEVPKVMARRFLSQTQACNLLRRFPSCQVYFSWCPLSKQEATESIIVFPKGSVCVVCALSFFFFFLNLFFYLPFSSRPLEPKEPSALASLRASGVWEVSVQMTTEVERPVKASAVPKVSWDVLKESRVLSFGCTQIECDFMQTGPALPL